MKKRMTANRGATETRSRIRHWVARNRRGAIVDAARLLEFINSMDERQNKRKGGLGR